MTTYHIGKFDCFKSSRLTMQSNWDEHSIFVHLYGENKSNSMVLSLSNLRTLILKANRDDCFIFHAQSSLIYLIISSLIFGLNRAQIVYDIHDLNVIRSEWNYSKFRGIIMGLQEFFVLKILKVRCLTVSTGLAFIIAKIYHVSRPKVVRNISTDIISNRNLDRSLNRLVYFGTLDRLPKRFFTSLEKEGLTLDVYGRFNYSGKESYLQTAIDKEVVRFKGEYNPKNLDFLLEYDFLYYNILPYDVNYRFAGPNKFFQSVGHGLKMLIPKGYSELDYLFSQLTGSLYHIEDSLEKTVEHAKLDQPLDLREVRAFLDHLKNESKENYCNSLGLK